MDRDRPHLFVPGPARAESYQRRRRKIPAKPYPPLDRLDHGKRIRRELNSAVEQGVARRSSVQIQVEGANPGLYFEFESFGPDGLPLRIESLESVKAGIEVVAVHREEGVERATVVVPDDQVGYFLKRLEQYLDETTEKGEPKHKPLVESIGAVRLATLRALWTEEKEELPESNESTWWEIWLRRTDDLELARLRAYGNQASLAVAKRSLEFPHRIVALAYGPLSALAGSIDVLSDIAEIRRAKVITSDLLEMPTRDQATLAQQLRERLDLAPSNAPSVCILDTGVNNGHVLLEDSLADEDRHAYDPGWGVDDRDGHVTQMAGLALFGDLSICLSTRGPIRLSHRLESVKILPNAGANPPDLYGKITAEAAARVEIAAPARRRVYSLAVAADDSRDQGRPSSWSAEIDQLAVGAGEEDRPTRLFLVSAGNAPARPMMDSSSMSDTEGIHDPGQSWNAITVGAFTERVDIVEPGLAGWEPLANMGELSPASATSLTWDAQWPIKPEILMEGGNWAVSPGRSDVDFPESLSLLTTHHRPGEKLFSATGDTSAATAQAARLAIAIRAAYPTSWDETIRALVIHSARWTKPMAEQLDASASKGARGQLLRRYGFGVPDAQIAIRSAQNALTLIVEDQILPFADGKMNEMHLHALPWPLDVLRDLGSTECRLRVTLSYFIEPNPGNRGWRKRHQYASHGLRFEVKTPTESVDEFRNRLNQIARDASGDDSASVGDSADWFLGSVLRGKGSVHHDLWSGTAAGLADRGFIAIYPVSGWWKERKAPPRPCRYSLIVSVEVPEVDVDIYTPVESQIKISIPIEI